MQYILHTSMLAPKKILKQLGWSFAGIIPALSNIGRGNVAAPPATAREGGAAQGLAELGAILDNLLLLYSFPGQTCSMERYILLLQSLRSVMAHTLNIPPDLVPSGLSPAAMASDLRRTQLLVSFPQSSC
jgi:hypothetical protein